MTPEGLGLISAFLVGLFGSVHCVGMCGGIVGALTLGLPAGARERPLALLPYLFNYNLGRILSYGLAGALAGLMGAALGKLLPVVQAHQIGGWLTALFMIALGLYLGEWWRVLGSLEHWGGKLWRHIEPLGRHLLPVRHPGQALAVGLVWGWLPCGLVYATLVWALSSGSALQGSLLMLSFGLGTLPMLFSVGLAAHWLRHWSQKIWLRKGVGFLIILFGLYSLSLVLAPTGGGNLPPASSDKTETRGIDEPTH